MSEIPQIDGEQAFLLDASYTPPALTKEEKEGLRARQARMDALDHGHHATDTAVAAMRGLAGILGMVPIIGTIPSLAIGGVATITDTIGSIANDDSIDTIKETFIRGAVDTGLNAIPGALPLRLTAGLAGGLIDDNATTRTACNYIPETAESLGIHCKDFMIGSAKSVNGAPIHAAPTPAPKPLTLPSIDSIPHG